jgi:hypothetical protein
MTTTPTTQHEPHKQHDATIVHFVSLMSDEALAATLRTMSDAELARMLVAIREEIGAREVGGAKVEGEEV